MLHIKYLWNEGVNNYTICQFIFHCDFYTFLVINSSIRSLIVKIIVFREICRLSMIFSSFQIIKKLLRN